MALELPIMPLNTVLFPGMPLPLFIFEERYLEMFARVQEEDRGFGVALIREGQEVAGPAIPYDIGTTAKIVTVQTIKEAALQVVSVGERRFRLERIVEQEPYLVGEVELLGEGGAEGAGELDSEVRELFQDYLHLALQLLGQPDLELSVPDDTTRLSYMVAAHLTAPLPVRQQLLELDSVRQRLFLEKQLLGREAHDYRLILAARRKYDELGGEQAEDEIFSVN